jgi:hypothetical protein
VDKAAEAAKNLQVCLWALSTKLTLSLIALGPLRIVLFARHSRRHGDRRLLEELLSKLADLIEKNLNEFGALGSLNAGL